MDGDRRLESDSERPLVFSRRRFLAAAAASGAAAAIASLPGVAAAAQAVPDGTPVPEGRTLEYWIQADTITWNVAPNGRDDLDGGAYASDQASFQTAGYRAYSPNWAEPLPGDASIGENLGIPGPVIRGRVGDTILIHFKNNDTRTRLATHSINARGLRPDAASDGFWHGSQPSLPGTAVLPGENYTYRYTVPASAAGAWLYHDYASPRRERRRGGPGGPGAGPNLSLPVYTRANPSEAEDLSVPVGADRGLIGMIVIEDADTKPVDHEHVIIFHDLYSAEVTSLAQDFDCINGRSFIGNTPTFHAKVGDRVRWRVGTLGRENHVFHIHGHRWLAQGAYTDTHLLGPGTTVTVEYTEDSPGTWLYHCHFTEHMMGGMVGQYVVTA